MKTNLNAHLAVLLATVVVASSFPVSQRIAPFLDPVFTVLSRFVISIVAMLPILFLTDKIKRPTGRRLVQFFMVGISQAGFFILMFISLKHTSSLHTAVIYTLLPSLAAIAGLFLLKEGIRPLHLVLLPAGILSTLWVIFEGSFRKLIEWNLNPGDWIFGVGLLLLSVYVALLKKFDRGGSPFDMVFWSIVCALFPMVLYFVFSSAPVHLEGVPLDVYLWIIYLAAMTVFTNFVWAYGGPRLGPMKTMAYSYSIPSVVLIINWVVVDKSPVAIVLPGVFAAFVITLFLQLSKYDADNGIFGVKTKTLRQG